MNSSLLPGNDVALFIDWENFKISLAAGHRMPNVSALKEEVSNHGRVVVAKAYADWVTRAPELRGAAQFINDPPALYAAGIEPVYVPTRLPGGHASSQESYRWVRVKNSVDVKMTADCIECAHSYTNIGTFVLVSGDSDFIHVINTLRTMGKRVIIIGVSWSTSRRLADQVDGLILYDTDVDPITPPEPAPLPSNGRGKTRDTGSGRGELPQVIRIIEEIVRTERQAGGTPLLTSIKQRLMRRFPSLDEKKLGFSGFKKLMLRVAQEGNIKIVTSGLVDWAVMADEPDPKGAIPGVQTDVVVIPAVEEDLEDDIELEVQSRSTRRAMVGPAGPSKPTEAEALSAAAESLREPGPAMGGDEASLIAGAGPLKTVADLELPPGPSDGQDAQRVADLIIMADTLESREDVSYVAFNFLVAEICQALSEGLKAQHEEITQRWSQAFSRPYITRMVRSLGNEKLLVQGWHSWREPSTGQHKRRRSLRLNRSHPLVQKTLADRWKPQLSPKAVETGQGPAPAVIAPLEGPIDGQPSLPAPAITAPSASDNAVPTPAGTIITSS